MFFSIEFINKCLRYNTTFIKTCFKLNLRGKSIVCFFPYRLTIDNLFSNCTYIFEDVYVVHCVWIAEMGKRYMFNH